MNSRVYRMTARAESAERTRTALLDAMLERFRAAPFASIRLDDVAADAGVTPQTAIRHFGGKEQLVAACAVRELERIAAARAAPAFSDPRTAIAALCAYYEVDGDLIARFEREAEAIPALTELARRGRAFHIDWIERVLTGQVSDDERALRVAKLVAVLDVRTWQILRREQGLDAAAARRALEELAAPRAD